MSQIPPPIPVEPQSPGFPGARPPPPTIPGAMRDTTRPPAWPKVIGVIAIVFGSGGVLGGLINIGSPYMMSAFSRMMPRGAPNPYAAFGTWANRLALASVIGALVAGMLLWGGILLVKHRRKAVKMLVAWSIIKIIFGVAIAWLTAVMQHDMLVSMFDEMQKLPGPGGRPPPQFPSAAFATGMAVVVGLFMIIWAWLLPVFLLIWFTRTGVKASVGRWSDAGVSP